MAVDTCGVLDHGFARVRCDACTHEYLLAFSCKARYFCPSCHAKRLAFRTLWLEASLLVAGAPHRQVVLTIPKRLRPWCFYRRTLLGDLARVAARTMTEPSGRSPESPRSRWVSWAAFRRTARSRTGIRTLLVAHAEHIDQIAIIAGWSHARIAVTYWFAMAVCGAIAVLVSRDAAHIAQPARSPP